MDQWKTQSQTIRKSGLTMKIYKFGGASVKNGEAVKNMTTISQMGGPEILIVVSAMGKSTNALEEIHQAWRANQSLTEKLDALYHFHHAIAQELQLNDECFWIEKWNQLVLRLNEIPTGDFDFTYDQIIPYGEILSTSIIHDYWNAIGFRHQWLDATSFIKTDHRHREARINWDTTNEKIKTLSKEKIYITQGFIGSDEKDNWTTLGREGSDYSASIFAHGFSAESVTIWKDVAGMLSADPKIHADAELIPLISYSEAIELAYYGASVIHPKTIQPLQPTGIPLHIKSFVSPQDAGTSIGQFNVTHYPTCIIEKSNQILASISTKDFSFIVEDNLQEIFSALNDRGIKIQMMENGARSFSMCLQCEEHKLLDLQDFLKEKYNLRYNAPVKLITLRHYQPEDLKKWESESILMEQKNRTTARFVIQNH